MRPIFTFRTRGSSLLCLISWCEHVATLATALIPSLSMFCCDPVDRSSLCLDLFANLLLSLLRSSLIPISLTFCKSPVSDPKPVSGHLLLLVVASGFQVPGFKIGINKKQAVVVAVVVCF